MCEHLNKQPYKYGYLSDAMVEGLYRKEYWYGGPIKTDDLPQYFCPDCLEDLD